MKKMVEIFNLSSGLVLGLMLLYYQKKVKLKNDINLQESLFHFSCSFNLLDLFRLSRVCLYSPKKFLITKLCLTSPVFLSVIYL